MIRLAVSVEGRTEREFVKSVLAESLRPMVEPTPILLGRARGRGAGGGNVTVERLASEMADCYPNFDAVTSLVDFYGFRGKEKRTVEELEEHLIEEIEKKISRGWDRRKAIPYVQKHEFEGLLFSDVDAFAMLPGISNESLRALESIRAQFPTPEDINDVRETAPSKRIAEAVPKYSKVVDGPQLAEDMGLPAIRAACPRFDGWLTRLELLGQSERGAS